MRKIIKSLITVITLPLLYASNPINMDGDTLDQQVSSLPPPQHSPIFDLVQAVIHSPLENKLQNALRGRLATPKELLNEALYYLIAQEKEKASATYIKVIFHKDATLKDILHAAYNLYINNKTNDAITASIKVATHQYATSGEILQAATLLRIQHKKQHARNAYIRILFPTIAENFHSATPQEIIDATNGLASLSGTEENVL
jgi:hypothetical protein